jgi:uncharacterized membrane protein
MWTGIFFLFLIELIFMKDILLEGEWFRANTVFKVTTQVWIWISLFLGPVFVWIYTSLRKKHTKAILIFILLLYLSIGAIYPVIASNQAYIKGRDFVGIDQGLKWWEKKYPQDFEAYLFLRDLRDGFEKDQKLKRIVEAEGESYTDVSRFSVFLGWPTVVGWPVHEWTWRGGYGPVAERRSDVREIYTGFDIEETRNNLEKYKVDYIIIGQMEEQRYPNSINHEKLRDLGNIIFDKNGVYVVEL